MIKMDISTAIILAAGRGSRLKELSLEQPKPMTRVNDTAIIENLIRQLLENNLKNIVVVVGYQADKLQQFILESFGDRAAFHFVNNDIFDKTNNIYSLYLAREFMRDGFYLFEADVFCEDNVLCALLKAKQENVILIDKFTSEMNGTVVALDSASGVSAMFLSRDQGDGFDVSDKYKTLNFYKFSAAFIRDFLERKLEAHIHGENVNSYYEQIVKEAVDSGYQFFGLKTAGAKWWEIDTIEDLEKAEEIFKMQKRGG